MKLFEYLVDWFKEEPVPTEYAAYRCLKSRPLRQEVNYLAVPWAALIHRGALEDFTLRPVRGGFTVCQHIHYPRILPLIRAAGVDVLFTPHADREEPGVEIRPFPHYAVHAAEPAKSKDIWYSFVGLDSTSQVRSDLRRVIFEQAHPPDSVVVERRHWHWARQFGWGDLSREEQAREKAEYRDILARSRFSLCPRGTGPSTIRFWESLRAGAIPVLFSDALRLPEGVDWGACVVRVPETDASWVARLLAEISPGKEAQMRKAGREAYREFSGVNFVKNIRLRYDPTGPRVQGDSG